MSCDPKMTGAGKSSGNSSGSGGSGGSESNGSGGNNGSGEGGSNEKLANDTTEANIKFNKQRVDEITAEMRKKGYNDIQIAAALGHWKNESGFRLDALNRGDGRDGSDSIGLAQWNSSRAAGLKNYAAQNGLPVNSVAAQVGWFDYEMKNTEKGAGYAFKNATTVAEASWAMNKYERFQGYNSTTSSQTISRLQNSNTFYSYITKK
ncbi:tail length tape measure protein [Agrobacterium phage Atu_ph07]|uniref:PE-PGRS virulence associated protein n=1 Tax=Agrobacterium phage Atu_ph07 TaxID=2024264 RepID=A0A2L0V0Z1_9CAUD|nr:tail length tape measure protein [Agrobacterium phage Atu_ph07]AUZ95440.1 PE-PGRS virulence associated protein [Agrobacterium phage Atu_ph07]